MTSNLYFGLKDFDEMMFLLHFLREGDLFMDVGANHGVYSLLASGLAGAECIALEPVPETYARLKKHVEINSMEEKIHCINKGVGEEEGSLNFSNVGKDGLNHVVTMDSPDYSSSIEVPVTTLDRLPEHTAATMMKLDIEGYEWHALKGASSMLESDTLKAIILEFNVHAERYGILPEQVEMLLREAGYETCDYDPVSRKLKPVPFNTNGNSLWSKDVDTVGSIIKQSKAFTIYGRTV